MSKRKQARAQPGSQTNAVQQMLDRAHDLDRRRQMQVQNQIGSINRLADAMTAGVRWTYDDEMRTLHEAFAALQVATSAALERVRELEEGDTVGKRKDAFLAGFAAGETEDDAAESWAAYKESLDSDTEPDEDTDGE